jgi:hypothetical protein
MRKVNYTSHNTNKGLFTGKNEFNGIQQEDLKNRLVIYFKYPASAVVWGYRGTIGGSLPVV